MTAERMDGAGNESGAAAAAAAASAIIQFAPFSSQIAPSLWTSLAALKIDKLQLSDETVTISARYSTGRSIVDRTTGDEVLLPISMSLDGASFDADSGKSAPANCKSVIARGHLKNYNTIEDYKNADKAAILQQAGNAILEKIESKDASHQDVIASLSSFVLLTFADLKKYKFVYWFAFPALVSSPLWRIETGWIPVQDRLSKETIASIESNIAAKSDKEVAFFVVRQDGSIGHVLDFQTFFAGTGEDERIVAFLDPSPHASQPGWPLRNLLALLAVRYNVRRIRVLCWKDEIGTVSQESRRSTIGVVSCSASGEAMMTYRNKTIPLAPSTTSSDQPSVVGWERNAAGKLIPRMADLGPIMDPSRLADQAVDLNLKLMRWRILPEINLEGIQATKCLLLGAGTLGCYVARTLLGWGIRHITLVDSSTVSFSNPVRQPLFEFKDCLEGGKPKAECAADALRRVYPGVSARGIKLNIPMPGHPIPSSALEQTQSDVQLLEQLFDEHDVIYLLMDSRESRWLPTVLGVVKNKIVMNAALGFDGFLAMRHGASPSQQAQYPDTKRLGCYFCNDIVAPTDSLTDRTLDQMCTVTRPGLAAIASANLVELMVSILQHSRGACADAYDSNSKVDDAAAETTSSSILGRLPHQLRGSLYTFNNLLIHGPAYDKCTACSPTVLEAYTAAGGFDIVQRACNDEEYLRTLTGLDKLYDATADVEVDWSEDEGAEANDGDGELI